MAFYLEPEIRLCDGLLQRGGRERNAIYLQKGYRENATILILSDSDRLLSFINNIICCSKSMSSTPQIELFDWTPKWEMLKSSWQACTGF